MPPLSVRIGVGTPRGSRRPSSVSFIPHTLRWTFSTTPLPPPPTPPRTTSVVVLEGVCPFAPPSVVVPHPVGPTTSGLGLPLCRPVLVSRVLCLCTTPVP